MLCDWLGNLAPASQPIRSKTKTNRDWFARVFPRLATCICFEFWLVHWIVCDCCDWPKLLLWLWFNDTQVKTALCCCRSSVKGQIVDCSLRMLQKLLSSKTSKTLFAWMRICWVVWVQAKEHERQRWKVSVLNRSSHLLRLHSPHSIPQVYSRCSEFARRLSLTSLTPYSSYRSWRIDGTRRRNIADAD